MINLFFFCPKEDEPMNMSVLAEEGQAPFQKKLQDDEPMEVEDNPLVQAKPAVLPQASTPVSQSTPVFTPGSLPIPSQPEFSHVSFVDRFFFPLNCFI